MGADDAVDRTAAQKILKMRLPNFAADLIRDTRIDNHPLITVF